MDSSDDLVAIPLVMRTSFTLLPTVVFTFLFHLGFGQTSLHDSVPYQQHPALTSPVSFRVFAEKTWMECDHHELLAMIEELEVRLAEALNSVPVMQTYHLTEIAGTRNYGSANCYVLRDSILSLQVQLDAALAGEPQVLTLTASDIAQHLATLKGAVADDGNLPLLHWGFKVGLTSDLSDSVAVPFGEMASFFATSQRDTGHFEFQIGDLPRYSQIHYAAFATNAEGTAFGDTLSFFTLPDVPSGLTLDTANATSTSAQLVLNVSDAGGQGPDSVKFFWSQNAFASLAEASDSALATGYSGTDHTFDLTGLTRYTSYQFNAYARNLAGQASSDANFVFTTLPEPPSISALPWDVDSAEVSGTLQDYGGDGGAPLPDSVFVVWGSSSALTPWGGYALGTYDATDSSWVTRLSQAPGGANLFAAGFAANSGGIGSTDTLSITTRVGVETVAASNVTLDAGNLEACFSFVDAVDSIGFKWSTQPDLSGALDSVRFDAQAATSLVDGCNQFSVALTGLSNENTYYYVAFAGNSAGEVYGDTLSFTPVIPFNCGGETVTYDGYNYSTVQIGSQCWFAENLRTTKYADGSSIPLITSNSSWSNAYTTSTGARCSHTNSGAHLVTFGYLYNWYAVMNPAGLCPTGWHAPSKQEFDDLVTAAGGYDSAGLNMKSSPSDSPSWNGNNSTGFNGLAGGYRMGTGNFFDLGSQGHFWSTSTTLDNRAWHYNLYDNLDLFAGSQNGQSHGRSVRCLKDE